MSGFSCRTIEMSDKSMRPIRKMVLKTVARFNLAIIVCLIPLLSFAADNVQEVMSTEQINAVMADFEQKYPAGSIDSVPMVENLISAATKTKADLQTWFLQSERDCYKNFFVTDCLNKLRTTRTKHNITIQRILVEAKAYQRQLRIEQLDEELRLKQERAKK
jgi:hypothetical protein